MEWTPGGPSNDIEDRRDDGGGSGPGFGGFGGIHLGIGGTVVLLLLSFLFHRNFFAFFSGAPTETQPATSEPHAVANDREFQLVSFVLDDVQQTWDKMLPEQANVPYRHAKLVLFRDYTDSGCGTAQSATGPFYCPEDEKVYIDLSFFDELKSRFGAPGEFAQAYVIAHEIGHHVQKLLGIEGKVQRLRRQEPAEANPLSVRLELQADCCAGVGGHSTEQRRIMDQSDVRAGLDAAAADDLARHTPAQHVGKRAARGRVDVGVHGRSVIRVTIVGRIPSARRTKRVAGA